MDDDWGTIIFGRFHFSQNSMPKSWFTIDVFIHRNGQVPVMRNSWAENRENSVRSVRRLGDRCWIAGPMSM